MNQRSRTLFLVFCLCLAACSSAPHPANDAASQEAACRSYSLSNNPDVTPPRRVRGDQPAPPQGAQGGYVCVRVTITESGSVIDPVVVKTDNDEYAQAFVRSLSGWQYTPATRGSARVVYHTVLFAHFPSGG
ncbi:MAG: energy transducer TonB [Thermoanaerobaculia bacterium]